MEIDANEVIEELNKELSEKTLELAKYKVLVSYYQQKEVELNKKNIEEKE